MTWHRAIAAVATGTALGVASAALASLIFVEVADGRTNVVRRITRGTN